MPQITINNTVIDFPNTGSSPVWSEAVIQFATSVEAALSGLITTGDITKQAFNLDSSHNPGTNITVPGMSFSSTTVRSGFIRYSVFRQTSGGGATTVFEAGTIDCIYNANGTPGQLWTIQREYVGDAQINFFMDDNGQFTFTTNAIAGSSHTGKISFVGQALLQ